MGTGEEVDEEYAYWRSLVQNFNLCYGFESIQRVYKIEEDDVIIMGSKFFFLN